MPASKLTRVVGPNPLNLPPKGLDLKLAALTSVVATSDFAPTRQSYDVFSDLEARVDSEMAKLQEVLDIDLGAFLSLIGKLDVPIIVP